MLRLATKLSLVAALLVACQRLSPEEQKIVGTWQFEGFDAIGRMRFSRYHRVSLSFVLDSRVDPRSANARFGEVSWGTWRLAGDQLTCEMKVKNSEIPKTTDTVRIVEFGQDKLVFENDRPPFVRVR